MKFFEKILKKRFHNLTSSEGIDADDLWATIANELPPENPAKDNLKISNGRKFLLFFIGMGLITGLYFFGTTNGSEETLANHKSIANTSIEFSITESETATKISSTKIKSTDTEHLIPITFDEQLNQLSVSDLQTTAKKKPKNELGNWENNTVGKIITEENNTINNTIDISEFPANKLKENNLQTKIPIELLNNNISSTSHINQEEISPNGITAITITEATHNQSELNLEKVKTTVTNDQTILADKVEVVNLLEETPTKIEISEAISLTALPLKISEDLMPRKLQESAPLPLILPQRSLPLSIGVFAGGNFWKTNFKATNSEDNQRVESLNNANSMEAGFTMGVEATWHFRNHWQLITGMEWSKTYSTFDFNQTRDSFKIIDNEEVFQIFNRTVHHHNQLNFLTIPIMIGKSTSFGRMTVGLNAGVALNFVMVQNGKSLTDRGNIATFDDQQNQSLPYNNFFVSYAARPYASFKMTKHLSLGIHGDLRYQNHGTSDFHNLKQSSILLGWNAGLQWRF